MSSNFLQKSSNGVFLSIEQLVKFEKEFPKEIIDYLALYGAMTITLKDGVYGVKKDKHQGKAGGTQMVIISRDLTIISSKST